MNRKLLCDALSMIDDAYIEESMVCRSENMRFSPERTLKMERYRNRNSRTKRLIALGIAVCLALALAATAGAANLWGIRDMWEKAGREFPQQAQEHIQSHTDAAGSEEWSCRITQSLCEGTGIMAAVTVSCSERYVLVPADASAADPTEVIGIASGQTLAEYAAAQSKELLFVGATLMKDESLGITGESQQFESVSDGEMVILLHADKKTDTSSREAVLTVYASGENGEREELQLSFVPGESPDSGTAVFVPVDPDAIAGLYVGEATVTETPLGISVCFEETITDHDAFSNMEMICEEITGFEGGSVKDEDGRWYLRWSMGQGELTDTLTIRFYDLETQEHIGDIVFMRK